MSLYVEAYVHVCGCLQARGGMGVPGDSMLGTKSRPSVSVARPISYYAASLDPCLLYKLFACMCLNCLYLFYIMWKYTSLSLLETPPSFGSKL